MLSVYKTKTAIKVFLTSLCVGLSYQIKDLWQLQPSVPRYVIAIISFFLAVYLSSFISNAIFRSKWIRKKVIGRTWLEGYWYLQTIDGSSACDPTLHGIIKYSYVGEEFDLSATGYHLSHESIVTRTHSRLIELRKLDLLYVNHFVRSIGPKEITGIAVGHFNVDSNPYPITYHGRITFFDNIPTQQQIGHKIDESEIQTYIKQYKNDWKTNFLLDKRQKKITDIKQQDQTKALTQREELSSTMHDEDAS